MQCRAQLNMTAEVNTKQMGQVWTHQTNLNFDYDKTLEAW